MFYRSLATVLLALFCSMSAMAQYSEDVMALKNASDLYDERGYLENSSISVDGNLMVAGANGSVSYSYPISSQVRGGYPLNVTLNYAGSVSFTAYRKHVAAHDLNMTPYKGWEKFSQQRPAWILGANGFALNVLSQTSHFTADPASRIFNSLVYQFDDKDFTWTIDGYDACGRMTDFNADHMGQDGYTDVIRLLRADGSLLQLVNRHTQQPGDSNADMRQSLYTGYYIDNSANARGYGIVEYDSTYWPQYIRDLLDGRVGSYRAAQVPRKLRYYAGDGLEYIFREWIIPYGGSTYRNYDHITGGVWAGPTIFYLEEIRSSGGVIAEFHRTRHYPHILNASLGAGDDQTRGRALITSFAEHTISFGHHSMLIEGLGRTTKVKFDTIMRSGTAPATSFFPYEQAGGMTQYAQELASLSDQDARLHRSYLAYVTEIIDHEDRVTRFDYSTHSRTYEDFNFPWPNVSGTPQRITLKNYRLKSVTEPTAKYVLTYRPGYNSAITRTMTELAEQYQETLNDVVDSVNKYDPFGNHLTTEKYEIDFIGNISTQKTIDRISGQQRLVTQKFRTMALDQIIRYSPPPRHTYVSWIYEQAGDHEKLTEYDYRRGSEIPGITHDHRYVIQPVAVKTTVNDVVQDFKTFSYSIDTVRRFGGDTALAGRFGMEVTRRVANTMRPDSITAKLFSDTTELLHLPLVDTTLVWTEQRWLKLNSWRAFDSLQSINHPFVRGRTYAELRYIPPVGQYEEVTMTDPVRIPPLFGLERASWRTAGALVSGKKNHYETGIALGRWQLFRGNLLADTIIGNGGALLPGGSYRYQRGYLRNLPVGAMNALGARTMTGYDHFICPDDTVSNYQCTYAPPVGLELANNDSVRAFTMYEGSYSALFAKPVVQRQIVRRYDATGTLREDTLSTWSEATYHGLTSGAIDANGWYSRFAYDRNGRLVAGWLPGDFPRRSGVDTIRYSGTETIGLHGDTRYQRRIDILHCELDDNTNNPISWVETGSVSNTVQYDTLVASWPVIAPPECPCEGQSGTRKDEEQKGGDRQLLRTCEQDIPYNVHDGYKKLYGMMTCWVDSASPLKYASHIDSLALDVMVAAVDGECLHLEVAIDGLYSRTFVFNCPGGDEDENGGSGTKGEGRELLGSGITRVAGGYKLTADLTAIAAQLQAKPYGSAIMVELRMKTAGGTMAFLSGGSSEDLQPKLRVTGEFRRPGERDDYTVAFTHDDETLTNTQSQKIDDIRHTENRLDPVVPGNAIRRTSSRHVFGANNRLLRTEQEVNEPNGTSRTDTVRAIYDGIGQVRTAVDQEGSTIHTIYDAAGRVTEAINTDSTRVRTSYSYGSPASFSISGQDFYGFCAMTSTTNENGVVFTTYSDALGQVRREIADTAGLRLTTLYEYDLLGRLVLAINPKGDSTRYTYDTFGRVKTKSQPDIGTVSYAYDAVGNVRFTQTQKQAEEGRVNFNQYDDLNRLVYTGEANLEHIYDEEFDDICDDCYGARAERDDQEHPTHTPGLREEGTRGEDETAQQLEEVKKNNQEMRNRREKNPEKKGSDRSLQNGGPRLTQTLNPNVLNDGGFSQILTANKTLWTTPDRAVPAVPYDFWFRDCQLPPDSLLGETTPQFGRKIVLPAEFYPTISVQPATPQDFEHIGRYPEFGRTAVAYDALPELEGSVWENFPHHEQWDDLAPTGKVRNLKGREAAVAYRERGGEPYNYTVLSYDERGRVEALLRFTENLGFDAVYYGYNSMNQITRITVADAVRQFSTYYGFDRNGRVDSVWTELGASTSGLFSAAGIRYPGILERPDSAAIFYHYNKLGMVDSMAYPAIRTGIDYTYTKRKGLDSMIAIRPVPGLGMQPVFMQKLAYDSTGQITAQQWRHGNGPMQEQDYFYDPVQRLTDWQQGGDTTHYRYDNVGNRMRAISDHRTRRDEYFLEPGKNRLAERVQSDTAGVWGLTTLYSHNSNGSVIERQRWETEDGLNYYSRGIDQYGYSHRELLRRYVKLSPDNGGSLLYPQEDWYYRYSAGGERDQKRLYSKLSRVLAEDQGELPWVYYLLGGSKEQLAVYHGRQMQKQFCGDSGMRVMMYPIEYLTYVTGGTAPIVTLPDGTRNYRITDHLGSVRSVLNHSGNVLSTKDFMPFGKEQAVTGGDVRQGYIGKELDRESDVAVHGVRVYSADDGRFLSGDVLWEKYRGWNPYQYSLNSPVQLVDRNGKTVDFASFLEHGPEYAQTLLDELQKLTGLTLCISSEDCLLNVDWEKGIQGGSQTARDALLHAIHSQRRIALTVNDDAPTMTITGTAITFNPSQMTRNQRGSVGVNPLTLSWGIAFFHELKHTFVGGHHADPAQKVPGTIGEPDKFTNKIRAEMGADWGQLQSYVPYQPDPNVQMGYLPFTPEAEKKLIQGEKPETGYVRGWLGRKKQ